MRELALELGNKGMMRTKAISHISLQKNGIPGPHLARDGVRGLPPRRQGLVQGRQRGAAHGNIKKDFPTNKIFFFSMGFIC